MISDIQAIVIGVIAVATLICLYFIAKIGGGTMRNDIEDRIDQERHHNHSRRQ